MTGDSAANRDEPPPAVTARRMIAAAGHATLATLVEDGGPYASLVLLATAVADGRPLLLLSDLAVHSANLARDPRLSLLIDGAAGAARDLTEPRLTLLGWADRTEEPDLLKGFLARHESARTYAGFADFRLYIVTPAAGHLVASFGRIHRLAGADLLVPGTG